LKHIAIDARVINSSTGRYVERLVHYLEEIDSTNRYSILVSKKDLNFYKPKNKNFVVVEADFDNYSLSEQTAFKSFLDKLNADLVHFCMPQQPVLYKGKKVTTIHDLTLLKTYNSDKNWLSYHIKQAVGYFVFKSVIKNNNQIIVPSKFTKNEVIELSPIAADKINLTYESADIEKKELKSYKHPFKKFILYVGQQSDYKNIRRLGDAHQQLLKNYPDLGLILVGRKNASELNNEKYFKDQNYKNILFTDFIPDSQKDWLYTQASAYVFPSLMEGFGLPGLEAMGYGAPVVSSNATCLPEVYGDAALYFDPKSVDDMADKISQVLEDSKLRESLIQKGYEQLKKYSWKKMAQETHAIYEKVLNY
jgi:glycosyltransferase involved in cell wall biosynthesis